MAYLEYNFKVVPPQPGSDILIAMISELGFESFDQKENGFSAYIKEEEASVVDLKDLIFEDFTFKLDVKKIETTNWNLEWEKNFEPVVVENLLCIRAPFHSKNVKVKQEIVIMPKMSFGTGHHQTTRLICRAMFEHEFKNKRVLDMGCGTGILAILAKQLGANDILGIDIDEWSVENSIENCNSNGCANVRILKGDVKHLALEGPFDTIIANINKNVLKSDMKVYSDSMKQGSLIFLSGFFKTDVEELIQLTAPLGLEFVETKNEDEWAMMLLSKK